MSSDGEKSISLRSGEDKRIVERIRKLGSLLLGDEHIECYAAQRRIFALFSRRIAVACTPGRVLVMRPNLLPGYTLEDTRWQDLRNAHLREGIFGASLTIQTDARVTVIDGLRKQEAQAVYRFCQAQEQAWREKNRVRGMEEARAKAGGVQINGGAPAAPDTKERLQKAKDMFDSGLITDSEYESAKAKILNTL